MLIFAFYNCSLYFNLDLRHNFLPFEHSFYLFIYFFHHIIIHVSRDIDYFLFRTFTTYISEFIIYFSYVDSKVDASLNERCSRYIFYMTGQITHIQFIRRFEKNFTSYKLLTNAFHIFTYN